jgi:transposase, IS4 family
MDATWIITAFVVIDTLMERLGHRSDVRAQVPDSEILTIAVVAAKYVGSHHERAVQIMHGCGYLSGRISVSRFNRRLHQLADWMAWIPDVLGEVSPRATCSLSIASPCQSAVVCAPGRGRKVRGARILRVLRGETGEVLWMAFASGLPPGWRARTRSDAARRGARPDPSP